MKKIKDFKEKDLNSLVSPEMSKARGNKTGFNGLSIFIYTANWI